MVPLASAIISFSRFNLYPLSLPLAAIQTDRTLFVGAVPVLVCKDLGADFFRRIELSLRRSGSSHSRAMLHE